MGLQYLHETAKIVHRDIKPQNILLSESSLGYSTKLCDFGVSEKFETTDIMTKTAGTYHFFPPECCDPDIEEYSGKQADIWALGVTLYCMIFNQLPFWDHDNFENEYTILEFILKNEVELPEGSRTDIGKDLIELMYQMLEKDPKSRITMD